MTGIANNSKNCVTRIIQVKMGMRIIFIPGARILRMVTIKLMAPVSEAIPVICKPSVQKSIPWLGENKVLLFGAYMNQPPSAPPPKNHDEFKNKPPNKKHQKPNALMRGNATSRAPICNGTK